MLSRQSSSCQFCMSHFVLALELTGAVQVEEQSAKMIEDGSVFYEDHKSSNVTLIEYSKNTVQIALSLSRMFLLRSGKRDLCHDIYLKKKEIRITHNFHCCVRVYKIAPRSWCFLLRMFCSVADPLVNSLPCFFCLSVLYFLDYVCSVTLLGHIWLYSDIWHALSLNTLGQSAAQPGN